MMTEGDIVEIPLPDGRSAIGRVLHISQRTEGAVGFVVFGIKGQARNDVLFDKDTGAPLSMQVLGPLYTDLEAVNAYGWHVLQNLPMKDRDRLMTKRRVGLGVYVGDEYLGSAAELGEDNLKPMMLCGMAAVYKLVEKAFPEPEMKTTGDV